MYQQKKSKKVHNFFYYSYIGLLKGTPTGNIVSHIRNSGRNRFYHSSQTPPKKNTNTK